MGQKTTCACRIWYGIYSKTALLYWIPPPFHDFSFYPSSNENESFCTNAKQSVRWKLFKRPISPGNCWRWKQYIPLEHQQSSVSLHSVLTQTTLCISPLWISKIKHPKCKWQKCRSFRFGKLNFCIDYVFINTRFNVMLLSTSCMLSFLLLLKWNNKEKGVGILLSQPLFS